MDHTQYIGIWPHANSPFQVDMASIGLRDVVKGEPLRRYDSHNREIVDLRSYRRHAQRNHSSLSSPCHKCNGWGGVLEPRMAMECRVKARTSERDRAVSYVWWVRRVCNQCKSFRYKAKDFPSRADSELVQPTLSDHQCSQAVVNHQRGCDTCGEDKPEEEYPVLVTLTCAHQPSTCLTCVQGWIEAQLDSGLCHIRCPAVDCQEKMEPEDIQRQVSSDMYQR